MHLVLPDAMLLNTVLPNTVLPNTVLSEPARAGQPPARAGFVVSRAVGGAVVRNQVKRRLRHLVSERLPELPAGARLVVRALPAAADRSYQELGRDLEAAMAGATRRRGR